MAPAADQQSLFEDLVDRAGLLRQWEDVHGEQHEVSQETLETVLKAQGLHSGSVSQIKESLKMLEEDRHCRDGSLVIAEQGRKAVFSYQGALEYQIRLESGGETQRGTAKRLAGSKVELPAQTQIGYHQVQIGDISLTLAVAPQRCPSVKPRAGQGGKPWGVVAQLYSLRRARQAIDPGNDPAAGVEADLLTALDQVGDYAALAQLAHHAGRSGASALALSPVHAMFSADPNRYSPYSPSSRLFYNTLYVDPGCLGKEALGHAYAAAQKQGLMPVEEDSGLLDWPQVSRVRMAMLRAVFDWFEQEASGDTKEAFASFQKSAGESLQCHCIYEALHAHFGAKLGASAGWQVWPEEFHDANSPAVRTFAQQHEREVRFHAFLQWQAAEGLRRAQQSAREAGMPIGLISDLAIGTDGGGSHVWSRKTDILPHLSVGAPPDLFQPTGQDWGLTAFSPRALRRHGFAPFLETLRSALAHAGGVRIDHILGLGRMWLVPKGKQASEGVYLSYPIQEMLSLIALEAHRHDAIVVGENLGTVPAEFNRTIYKRGVMGTSVLWFERDDEEPEKFKLPGQWSQDEMSTTTTHDLPTVRGWWEGVDLQWRAQIQGLSSEEQNKQEQERMQERSALWQALCEARAAEGNDASDPPKETPRQAIFQFVAEAPSPLVMFPLEDLLDLPEQPNLPGPPPEEGEGHPNWRRRLPARVDELFELAPVRHALNAVCGARDTS